MYHNNNTNNMANDRNAGAKKKFPNNETEILHVRKIVPKGKATPLKKELIEKINQLQADALTKCANEALQSKQNV